jgi:hypothetical protein
MEVIGIPSNDVLAQS